MKLRKNAGTKKREKSLEISRFLAVWLAKRLFPSLGSKLTCQYGRAAGYSPTAKIPPPAAGKCEPTHLCPTQMPGRTVDPPANRKATPEGEPVSRNQSGLPGIRLRRRFPRLRRGNANRRICARRKCPAERWAHQPTEKPPRRVAFLLAGVAGFGPTDAGVKVPCLTAWRHPKTTVYYNTVRQGVSSVFCQLRGGAGEGGMFRTRSFPGDPV